MKIKVFLERENKEQIVKLNPKASVADLMKQLEVNAEEVITVINNEIATKDTKLKEKDNVKFLAVISGG